MEKRFECFTVPSYNDSQDVSNFQVVAGGGEDGEAVYDKVKTLGSGAFGTAVLYRLKQDSSLVVLKEIRVKSLMEKDRKAALNEVVVLSKLSHPNIIGYLDCYEDNGVLFIEMEFADGGNLGEFIQSYQEKGTSIPEEIILQCMYQLASALAHCHENHIIHRDLKPHNIFMNKSGVLKLGDFGISKLLEENVKMASTCVGTPFYLAPECIRGQVYDSAADMWSFGCIAHEMMTLRRTFEGNSLASVLLAAMQGPIPKLPMMYTVLLQELAMSCLRQGPSERPTAVQVLENSLFGIVKSKVISLWSFRFHSLHSSSVESFGDVPETERKESGKLKSNRAVVQSKTCELYTWGNGQAIPHVINPFCITSESSQSSHAMQEQTIRPWKVHIGRNHFAVVTRDFEVYTWGENSKGQLGHGNRNPSRKPKRVEYFVKEKISIASLCCGDDFTLCLTDQGALYAFGSNESCCLGIADIESSTLPLLLSSFSDPIVDVSCGNNHVVALTAAGQVFSWGCGESGRLGTGSESDVMMPQNVKWSNLASCKDQIVAVRCGKDSSFFLTASGKVFSTGNNNNNKLGLSFTSGLLSSRENIRDCRMNGGSATKKYYFPEFVVEPRQIRGSISSQGVMDVSSSETHTSFLTRSGALYTVGENDCGQLGLGHNKQITQPSLVRYLSGTSIHKVECGERFTVAFSADTSMVYTWGSHLHGRLGNVVPEGQQRSKLDGHDITSSILDVHFPKPILFDCSFVVSMSAGKMNCMIVVEKVISRRTMGRTDIGTVESTVVVESSTTKKASPSGVEPDLQLDSYINGPEQLAVLTSTDFELSQTLENPDDWSLSRLETLKSSDFSGVAVPEDPPSANYLTTNVLTDIEQCKSQNMTLLAENEMLKRKLADNSNSSLLVKTLQKRVLKIEELEKEVTVLRSAATKSERTGRQ